MERKTARISKEPEVRRQEILDTAMSVYMEKGYEAATMRDIAAAMHVVPGLCYRYFESKQMLYDTAIEQYVKDITHQNGTAVYSNRWKGKVSSFFS